MIDNPTNSTSLAQGYLTWPLENSWSEKFDIDCENSGNRSEYKTAVLLMNVAISLTILLLSDLIGRRRSIQMAGILILIGSILATFPQILWMNLVGLGLCFGSEGALSSLFSTLFNESDCIL